MTLQELLSDFVEEKTLAEAFGVSPRTTKRWRDEPDGLPFTKAGSKVLIHMPTAREWLMRRMRRPNTRRMP